MKSMLQAGKTLASDDFNSYNHVHLEKVVWEGEGWAILEPVSKPSQHYLVPRVPSFSFLHRDEWVGT